MRGNIYLLMASFLWGTTFVAQMAGMEGIGPFTYGMARYIIGFGVVLIIWRGFAGQRQKAKEANVYQSGWRIGLGAGVIMFIASALQQIALLYTTAGKTAFITCLYIVFVPILAVLLKKRIHLENWLGSIVAALGLYFLSVQGSLDLNLGDILAIGCSIFWSVHILFIDRFAGIADNIEISAAQLGICAILNTLFAFLLEQVSLTLIWQAIIPILYAAVMSSGIAFTLQIMGQRTAEPAPAAIIMSLESVFGALAGWLVLGEEMTGIEIIGCCLMLMGMLITQAGVLFKNKLRTHAEQA